MSVPFIDGKRTSSLWNVYKHVQILRLFYKNKSTSNYLIYNQLNYKIVLLFLLASRN